MCAPVLLAARSRNPVQSLMLAPCARRSQLAQSNIKQCNTNVLQNVLSYDLKYKIPPYLSVSQTVGEFMSDPKNYRVNLIQDTPALKDEFGAHARLAHAITEL